MVTQAEIEAIAAQITLNLDNPQSVRKQLQKLNLVQQRLMLLKRELKKEMSELNPQDSQQLANNILTAGMAFLPHGTRKWGAVARAGARELLRAKNKADRQPYLEIQDLIDDFLTEIANLRIQAQEYLLNQS